MTAEISQELEHEGERIAALPYTYTVVLGEDGIWTSRVLEISGVFGEGDDPSEAVASARDGLEDIVISLLEEQREVPAPFETREWSGDLRVRLTPTLHQRASTLAAEEGVSLNRWLSAAVGLAGSEQRTVETGNEAGATRYVAEETAGSGRFVAKDGATRQSGRFVAKGGGKRRSGGGARKRTK